MSYEYPEPSELTRMKEQHRHGSCAFVPPRVAGSVLYDDVAALEVMVLALFSCFVRLMELFLSSKTVPRALSES